MFAASRGHRGSPSRARLQALRAAVEELEPRKRAVYVAIYREERLVNEVAEALQVDRRTITRMLERMREYVAARLRPLVV